MNSYHILNSINSILVKKLTNEAEKYISESVIRILFRSNIRMLLNDLRKSFENNWTGRALGAALAFSAVATPIAAIPGPANDAHAQQMSVSADLQHTITPSKGNFATTDLRPRGVNSKFVEDAPAAASTGRVSVVLYGNSDRIMGATYTAAEAFSQRVHDSALLWAQDNDSNAGEVRVSVYGNGRYFGYIDVGVDADQEAVAKAVYKMMEDAYADLIKPRLIAALGTEPTKN